MWLHFHACSRGRQARAAELEALFSPFGVVRFVHVYSDTAARMKMENGPEAYAAMQALSGKAMNGALKVGFRTGKN